MGIDQRALVKTLIEILGIQPRIFLLALAPLPVIWWLILKDWRRGMYSLFLYIPFAGFVSLMLYPASWPKLLKDMYFVLPAYVAFALHWRRHHLSFPHIPRVLLIMLVALSALVIGQMFNPLVRNWLLAVIGAKVWLFYLPMILLGYELFGDRTDQRQVFRWLLVLSWPPCLLGLGEWFFSTLWGYRPTMHVIYGAAAGPATQQFAQFNLGNGVLYRIPSTFTFPTQYFCFLFCMFVPVCSLIQSEESPSWRRAAYSSFVLLQLAAYLSGIRAAYILIPVFIILAALLHKGLMEGLRQGILTSIILLTALKLPGVLHHEPSGPKVAARSVLTQPASSVLQGPLQPPPVLQKAPSKIDHIPWNTGRIRRIGSGGIAMDEWGNMMWRLLSNNSVEQAIGGFSTSLREAPWGRGTGMNTGAARYSFNVPDSFTIFRIYENYYAKCVFELGALGLTVVLLLFGSIIRFGVRVHRSLIGTHEHGTSATLLAFFIVFIVYSLKGLALDLDPVNIYFWIFVGILFKLPDLAVSHP